LTEVVVVLVALVAAAAAVVVVVVVVEVVVVALVVVVVAECARKRGRQVDSMRHRELRKMQEKSERKCNQGPKCTQRHSSTCHAAKPAV
jgi:Flp pilus assembly protein TadB